ncbi:hypothetical protein BSLG_004181 [Batrachochytrium salamandrivorans]|nr:hypothetical protein BSLG_004181 [Batrachochytrium salamandrivorans]
MQLSDSMLGAAPACESLYHPLGSILDMSAMAEHPTSSAPHSFPLNVSNNLPFRAPMDHCNPASAVGVTNNASLSTHLPNPIRFAMVDHLATPLQALSTTCQQLTTSASRGSGVLDTLEKLGTDPGVSKSYAFAIPEFIRPDVHFLAMQPSPTANITTVPGRVSATTKSTKMTPEHRQKVLERNRLAAVKSRIKKNQWMKNLEETLKTTQEHNQELQEKNYQLTCHVVVLKHQLEQYHKLNPI